MFAEYDLESGKNMFFIQIGFVSKIVIHWSLQQFKKIFTTILTWQH